MRTKTLLALRPSIETQATALSIEAFQNDVLRPILKFQNSITLQLLLSNKYYDSTQATLSKEKLEKYLTDLLKKDKAFRNQLIGMVLGLVTDEEFLKYSDNKKEYHKRIVSMQVIRYMDQLAK